jgi:ABC-type multidrug transport system ATPase subunit
MAVLKGLMEKTEREKQIAELLELVGLEEAADRRLNTYSGGMKRRVGIAQAFLGRPRLLIVDEPTSGLDPEERVRLRNLLAEMAERCTVILSTHIVEDISQSCNDVGVLNRGRVEFRGDPQELITRMRGLVWSITTGGERPDEELSVVSTLQIEGGRQYRVLGQPTKKYHAQPLEPSLEDGYIWLMRQSEKNKA